MYTQTFEFPGRGPLAPPPVNIPAASGFSQCGPNDSNIQRGDREDTGDNEARPDELGSGRAMPTVDPTALGGTSSIRHPSTDRADLEAELREDDTMEILEPTNRALGLTDVDDVPPEDWAADTGGTKTPGGGS